MPSIPLLISKASTDFPSITFLAANEFRWSPEERTVFYEQDSKDVSSLLHEVSHAILDHKDYMRDIELLELERAAWSYAQTVLSPIYHVVIDADQIEDSLDTYRNWLHARSTCPACHATGFQIKKTVYKCLACQATWRVNDARMCALRRYVTT